MDEADRPAPAVFSPEEVVKAADWRRSRVMAWVETRVVYTAPLSPEHDPLGLRKTVSVCPLFEDLSKLAEVMGILPETLAQAGALGFCGYGWAGADIVPHRPCEEIVNQFELMLVFAGRSGETRAEELELRGQGRQEVRRLCPKTLRQIADLKERVSRREECRRRLAEKFPGKGQAERFVAGLKRKLGLTRRTERTKFKGAAGIKQKVAESVKRANMRAKGKVKPPVAPDPFCLALRPQLKRKKATTT